MAGAPSADAKKKTGINDPEVQSAVSKRMDLVSGTSGLADQFGNFAKPVRTALVALAVVVASTLGFNVGDKVAQDNLAVKTGAAVVCGVAAATAGMELEKQSRKSGGKLIVNILQTMGSDDPEKTKAELQKLAKSLALPGDDFVEMLKQVYGMYLRALIFVSKGVTKHSEIRDLIKLKNALGLSGAQVGDAVYEAGREFYRENVVWIESPEDDPNVLIVKVSLDKLLFLADRIFHDKETEQAAIYENSRLWKIFNLTDQEARSRIVSVAIPFFRTAVNKAVTNSQIENKDLVATRDALGLSESNASRICFDAYQAKLSEFIKQKGQFNEVDLAYFARLRSTLGISEQTSLELQKNLSEPEYRQAVKAALAEIEDGTKTGKNFTQIYSKLAMKQSELRLPSDTARRVLASEIRDQIISRLQIARKNLRVNNMSDALKNLKLALHYGQDVLAFLKVGMDEKQDPNAALRLYMGDVTEELGRQEPRQLYRMFLGDCLSDRIVDEEEDKLLKLMRVILDLTDKDALDAYRVATGPLYRKEVAARLAQPLTPESKSEIDTVLSSLSVPAETVLEINRDLYRDQLLKFTDGNRILSLNDAGVLAEIRNFLNLSMEDVADIHAKINGPIYEQSVDEAMGSSGIILEEYQIALAKLADRLGLTPESARELFYNVAKRRLGGYVQRAIKILQQKSSVRGANESRDVGDDPFVTRAGATLGIETTGMTIELSSMVEFYFRNKIGIETEEEYTDENGEKKTRTITSYPITVKGMFDPKLTTEVYRQYLIQSFSAGDNSEKQRLASSLDKLGPILGMSEQEIDEVHGSIGAIIYKDYIGRALSRGNLDERDIMLLANIAQSLKMSEKQTSELLTEAKKNRVTVLVERCFSSAKVLPEMVVKVRDTAKSLGVNLVTDLSVSDETRGRMFAVEVDHAIETGNITPTDQSALQKAQIGFQIQDQQAQGILLDCIQRRCNGLLTGAAAALRQDRLDTAVDDLIRMIRFGKLLPAEIKNTLVSNAEKQELLLVYQSYAIREGSITGKEKENLDLLKVMLGFESAAKLEV
eukprot:CAMPEP_0184697776 /NCGR_PEP_ID=MMETSP0313-20130426/4624_1 /TAXON_ID=2792 /ORGANISM="Porphyridium aerugineum, Strain SAG 1380-2" /LENGTH=1051 /DNA_ID=CAMNT_0027156613 /DNA_START=315 /DNA_END=3470 /DNA_ORIENTATION=+